MSGNGPFGLWMGMTLEDLNYEPQEVGPMKYKVANVPKPHSAFDYYVLQITPTFGLSWLKAVGKAIQTSIYGNELRAAFDSLEKKLSAIYGKGKRTDFLQQGSIWNEPRDWMQSLLHKERFFFTAWSPEHGSSLSNSLVVVALLVEAVDANNAFLALEYYFQNNAAADAELSAAEDEAL